MTDTRVLFGPTGGQPTGQLDIESLTYTEALGGAGSAQIVAPNVQPLANTDNFGPARSSVWIEINGQLRWCGFVAAVTESPAAGRLDIACLGWLSYFRRRWITTTLTSSGAVVSSDQVVNNIITHVGGIDGFDLTTFDAPTNAQRAYNYSASALWNVGEEINRINTEDDFLTRFVPYQNPAGEYKVRVIHDSQVGRRLADEFTAQNSTVVSVAEQHHDYANFAIAVGGTDPLAQLPVVNSVSSPTLPTVWQYVRSGVPTLDPAVLQSVALSDLTRRGLRTKHVTLELAQGFRPDPSVFQLGDTTLFTYEGFASVDELVTIAQVTVTVEAGVEQVRLQVARVGAPGLSDEQTITRQIENRIAAVETSRALDSP